MSVTIRQAGPQDVAAVVALFHSARRACLPYLPVMHTRDEDIGYFSGLIAGPGTVLLAQDGGTPAAFIAFGGGWIEHLYVAPERQGQGTGAALLARAQADASALQLWTFQRNEAARHFYAAHGFRELERTDGSNNEEREPDVRLGWQIA